MVGKNNSYLRESKLNDHFKRFSLRKLNIGVVSVAIAAGFYFGNGATAQAATTETSTAIKTEQVEQQDSNTIVAATASASNSGSANAVVLKSDTAPASAASPVSTPVSETADSSTSTLTSTSTNLADQIKSADANESNNQTASNSSAGAAEAVLANDLQGLDEGVSQGTAVSNLLSSSMNTNLTAVNQIASTNNATSSDEKPDVKQWTYKVVANGTANEIVLTGYTGTNYSTIVVPNAVDFANAGISISNSTVYLTYDLAEKLASKCYYKFIISNTGDAKVVACGSKSSYNTGTISIKADSIVGDADWSYIFAGDSMPVMDLDGLDTSQIINMSHMFDDCVDLTLLNVSNWNMSRVERTDMMFGRCLNLTSLNLSKWDMSKVNLMDDMFEQCQSLTSLGDVSNWNIENATDIAYMFEYCYNLTSLNLSKWNTSNVTYMTGIFRECRSLTSLDLSNWDTSKVENGAMEDLFITDHYTILEVITKDAKLLAYNYKEDNRIAAIFFNAMSSDAKLSSNGAETDWKSLTVVFTPEQAYSNTLTRKIDQLAADQTSKYQNLAGIYQATIKANPGLTAILSEAFDKIIAETATRPGYNFEKFYYHDTRVLGATDPQELISGGYLAQYTPDPQTMHIKYVNQKTNEVVKDDPVNGYTDKTVDTNSSVPGGGWKLVDGQQPAPKQITFKVGKTPDIIIIKVEHAHVTVLPTDPKTPLDELPDRAFEGYPTGVAENDLNKKIKRTINVHNLDGTITPIVQTAHLTRTADVDEVTLEVTYSDWTTGSWDKFTSTPVAGYTASLTELPAVKVYATTNDEIRDVIYTANNQSMRINYVSDDGDNVGEVIDFTPVNGHTDETVETNGKVPAGWKLADGQSIPAKITFKGAKTDDVSVKVKHAHVTVLPDNPKTTVDKLPDNENKNYPTGVAYTDLNKTITRTIEIDEPNGNIIFVPKQEVHYTRTADVDEVTGDVTYGNWTTTDEFAEFDGVPGIPGYAPSQSKVDAMTPKVDDHDSTVKITYTANEQSMHIIYVDGEGNTVKTDPVSGHTDETVKTNSTVPAGWKLADGQQPAPERITFKGAKTDDQTIKVKPAHVIVTADKPKTTVDKLPDNPTKNYPNGVAENDLNKTVKRTINVHNTDGTTTTVIQSVHFTRNADVDEAHGTVEYSEWKADKQFEQYIIPTVPGYVSVVDGKEQTMIQPAMPSISDHDSTIEVNYQAVDGSQTIDYVDKNDTVVGYQIITGKTSEEKTVKSAVPTGWKLVDGQQVPTTVTIKAKDVPIKIWIEHDHVQVSHDDPQVDGTKIPGGAADFHGVAKSDLNKTITRTITVVDPHKGAQTVTQPATIHRDATVDKVDGSVVYGDWTTAEWPAYEVPAVAGYTPSQATVGAQTVTNETKDTPVTVTYTANAQTMHVKYVDAQGNVVKSDPVSGHTDETVKTNSTVPAGWKLADGQSVPTEITFKGAKTDDVTVKVEHDHVQVSHDDPQVDGTKIPGGAADFHGVAKSDLNKTITRTITVVDPHKGAQTVTQPATIHRDATVDKVDGSVVYGDWTTAEWPAYKVPVVDGYTPSQATVGAQTVTSETKDTPVTVTYAANAQTMHIKYVDAQGNVVKSDPVSGHTDETVKTNSTVPAGWKLMNGQSVPATIKFSANTPDVTVKVEHSYVTVLPDNPKTPADVLPDNPGKNYPSGVAKDDLNKTVTRTINITTPDGKTQTITQKAEFTRSATVDEVTGEVTYGPWSKNVVLESVDVPNIPGYAPSASVPEITVTPNDQDTTINITYKKLGSGNAAGQGGNASNGGSTTGQTAQNGQSGQTPNNAGAQQLPQTGNANNEKSALGLAGAMFAAGLGLGFGSKKKRHED